MGSMDVPFLVCGINGRIISGLWDQWTYRFWFMGLNGRIISGLWDQWTYHVWFMGLNGRIISGLWDQWTYRFWFMGLNGRIMSGLWDSMDVSFLVYGTQRTYHFWFVGSADVSFLVYGIQWTYHVGSTRNVMSYSSRLQKLCASGKLRRTEATVGDNQSVRGIFEFVWKVFFFFARASACRVWDLARKFGSRDSLTEWKQLF